MSNKCPKCGAKLSPFYLKPNCPSCGVNIVQYGFDERLESDKIRAEKEWERFDNFLNGLKKSSIGSPIAIVRLISFFLPIVALLIPVYKVNGAGINLISIIKSIISDSASVFQNKAMLLCFISFAAVILTSLVCAVISLFSYTKTDISEISFVGHTNLHIYSFKHSRCYKRGKHLCRGGSSNSAPNTHIVPTQKV